MHSLKLCGIVFIALVLFYCCDPCNNLDCVTDNYYGQFRIVSADGNHLVLDVAYMQLNDNDTGTIRMSYNVYDTKCCGSITEITNFRLNNSVNIPGSKGTQEIKK